MPLIEPYFSIPNKIPIVGGDWGPWFSRNVKRDQQIQVFVLFIVSLILIVGFGAWAYFDDKNKKENPTPVAPTAAPKSSSSFDFADFINVDKLVDMKSFGVGISAGVVFGLIDNGGLWFGMDALEPVFDPNQVPWVYGYGGRRQFHGCRGNKTVYDNAKFKDGKLKEHEKRKVHTWCKQMEREYKEKLVIAKKTPNKQKRTKLLEEYKVNEAAFADPSSQMFLGENMTKNEFFRRYKRRELGQELYEKHAIQYRNYLNDVLPASKLRSKRSREKQKDKLKMLEGRVLGVPFKINKNSTEVSKLRKEIRRHRIWPGRNRKLATAYGEGWRPGSLTNAGVGNTYSDLLGSFLSTFVAVLISNASGITETSLISETIGIGLGCILGIVLARTILAPLTYKT